MQPLRGHVQAEGAARASGLQGRPDPAADAQALMTHVRVTVTRVAVWSPGCLPGGQPPPVWANLCDGSCPSLVIGRSALAIWLRNACPS